MDGGRGRLREPEGGREGVKEKGRVEGRFDGGVTQGESTCSIQAQFTCWQVQLTIPQLSSATFYLLLRPPSPTP
jgi:hypothetical protein